MAEFIAPKTTSPPHLSETTWKRTNTGQESQISDHQNTD